MSYHTLHYWNRWFRDHFLGAHLITNEQQILATLIQNHLGKHAVLIGLPGQQKLLEATKIPCQSLISPLFHNDPKIQYVESEFYNLPIQNGSIDLVLLPHMLEIIDHPRKLLLEACRIIKPEGLIVVFGINPISFWGIKNYYAIKKNQTGQMNLLSANKIKTYLQLADFQIEQQSSLCFTPPIANENFFQKLTTLDFFGKIFPMFAGVYVLIARSKVIPLTPIRLRWKQQLRDLSISTTISGQIVS